MWPTFPWKRVQCEYKYILIIVYNWISYAKSESDGQTFGTDCYDNKKKGTVASKW